MMPCLPRFCVYLLLSDRGEVYAGFTGDVRRRRQCVVAAAVQPGPEPDRDAVEQGEEPAPEGGRRHARGAVSRRRRSLPGRHAGGIRKVLQVMRVRNVNKQGALKASFFRVR